MESRRQAVPEPRFDPAVDPILCSPYAEPDQHWQP